MRASSEGPSEGISHRSPRNTQQPQRQIRESAGFREPLPGPCGEALCCSCTPSVACHLGLPREEEPHAHQAWSWKNRPHREVRGKVPGPQPQLLPEASEGLRLRRRRTKEAATAPPEAAPPTPPSGLPGADFAPETQDFGGCGHGSGQGPAPCPGTGTI